MEDFLEEAIESAIWVVLGGITSYGKELYLWLFKHGEYDKQKTGDRTRAFVRDKKYYEVRELTGRKKMCLCATLNTPDITETRERLMRDIRRIRKHWSHFSYGVPDDCFSCRIKGGDDRFIAKIKFETIHENVEYLLTITFSGAVTAEYGTGANSDKFCSINPYLGKEIYRFIETVKESVRKQYPMALWGLSEAEDS